LEKHYGVLDCYNKAITYLNEKGKQGKIQGILRVVTIRQIPSMQLKKSFIKGCQIFAVHMEKIARGKVASVEYHLFFRYFENVFEEILGLPPKRDIDLSIDLVPGDSLVSKTPCRMGTPKLKES